MQLVAHKLGPQSKHDRLRCVREDGSQTACELPRQGILPHDLIHALVESRLGLRDGFLGLVARGADIAFSAQAFSEYIDPARHAEVAVAESVVEGLQAQLWSGAFDAAAFRDGVAGACAMRGVAAPDLAMLDARTELFEAARVLGERWHALPAGGEWRWRFPLDADAALAA